MAKLSSHKGSGMTSIHRPGTDPELTSDEAAALLCISGQAVRVNCAESRYPAAHKDASGAWRIPLSSLPPLAQARHYVKNLHIAPGGWQEDDRRDLSAQPKHSQRKRVER